MTEEQVRLIVQQELSKYSIEKGFVNIGTAGGAIPAQAYPSMYYVNATPTVLVDYAAIARTALTMQNNPPSMDIINGIASKVEAYYKSLK